MLLNLHVKNFALIDEADLDLGSGLNILTGETGAGKSILIDSVGAALGGRVRGDVIGKYGDSAYVELVFSVDDDEKRKALQELEISTEYDCILVSRKIMEGRSIHKINDETVTSAKVKKVTELLLDIHGQHEHQSLLHKQKHLEILDQYTDRDGAELREQVAEAYDLYSACRKKLDAFDQNPEVRARETDFLRYEISEIERAAVSEGEEEELTETFRRFRNSERLAGNIGEVLDAMGDRGASGNISRATRYLRDAASLDAGLADTLAQLETVEDLALEAERSLRDYFNELSFEPEEYRRVENRLDEIHHIEQKYGKGYDAVARALEERREKLQFYEDYENQLMKAEEELNQAEMQLAEASQALGRLRRAASEGLCEAIRAALSDLNFLNVEFEINFTILDHYTRLGQDSVEFLISMNPGEPLRPLGQVASGGELSRIMLGIKAVLAETDEIPTLIFDEIDSGISGRTAQKVSEKLEQISRFRQVICITHLPQIAAMADRHFCIEKCVREDRTCTAVSLLNEEDSVRELARLLGGVEITEAVSRNAAELRRQAAALKGNRG